MERDYAVNPKEIAFKPENLDFPPLHGNNMPKKKGPEFAPGTKVNKITKGRAGRPVGGIMGL